MATKVRYKKTGKTYLFLGAGFGAYQSMSAAHFLEAWFPRREAGQLGMVAVCDAQGAIRWADYEDLEVIEVDGESPAALLG